MKLQKIQRPEWSALLLGRFRQQLFLAAALLCASTAASGQVVQPASYSPFSIQAPTSVTAGDAIGNGATQWIVAGNGTVTIVPCSNVGCSKLSTTAVGTGPVGVVIGDFNGDGRPDMAVANSGSNNVTILLNNGNATYSQPAGSPITVGTAPSSIVAGDLNGDGKLDLVVSNASSNNITVLIGRGDGTFLPGTNITVGNLPFSLAIADFNADGNLDLAVANQNDSTASILLGDGHGGFGPATGSPVAVGLAAHSVAAGDFNGDGVPDLAFTGGSGSATVFFGHGDGTFGVDPFGPFSVGSSPDHIAVGDIDGDGNLDLAVSSSAGNGSISVLLGNGTGGFFAASGFPFSTPTAHAYNWIAIGDVNGDGKLDVAATSSDNNLSVLLNKGSLATNPSKLTFYTGAGQGTSPPVSVSVTKPSGGSAVYSATGNQNWMGVTVGSGTTPDTLMIDVNPLAMPAGTYRGKALLSGTQNGDGNVAVTMNVVNPAGTLAALSGSPYTTGTGPRSIATGDFNGDGKPDLAIATSTDTNAGVTLLLSNGSGTFTPGSAISTVSATSAIAAGDINGDGKVDLVVGSTNSPGTVTVLLGNGHGVFTLSPGGPYNVGVNPNQIAIGDFNGDGKPDLVVSNNQLGIFLGIGGGGFEPGPAINCTCKSPLAVADFNGDGFADIAATNSSTGVIQIMLGTGSSAGIFTVGQTVSGITSPTSIVAADFNGDGKPDLATLNPDGSVSVVLGDGTGAFGMPINMPAVSTPGALIAADFNGDGKLDLAATNAATGGGLTVLLGNGAGGFTASSFATGSVPDAIVAADFNVDGTADLAMANFMDNNVTVLLSGLASTSTALTAPSSGATGQTINLNAQVTQTGTGFSAPGGTVSFLDGANVIQTVNLVNGSASFSTTFSAGTHMLSAHYNGDVRNRASTSNVVPLSIIGPPLLGIAKSHTGPFTRGQQNVTYTVTVSNAASSMPTSGTVTVTETIPMGLTLVSMSGTAWTCPGTAANNCTRTDALNAGASYPPITVTANVTAHAPSQLSNQVSVSGGGSATNSTTDPTMITGPIPVVGDFDGNGVPDIVWQNDSTFQVALWLMGGAQGNQFQSFSWVDPTGQPNWSVVDVVDLNQDGIPDILLQRTTGEVVVWYMGGPQGSQLVSWAWIQSSPLATWKLVGAGDLNGDGTPDLIWLNTSNAQVAIWYMTGPGGNQFLSFALMPSAAAGWNPVGLADFNGDGHPDLVWQNATTRQAVVWFMGGPQGNQFMDWAWLQMATNTPTWKIVGLLDENADGHPDLIWQEDNTRQVVVWFMSGALGNTNTSAVFLAGRTTGWHAQMPH